MSLNATLCSGNKRVQITILRHGKPEFEWERYARGSEIRSLVKIYDSAGIIGNPSAESLNLAGQHDYVVCSDLPRSLQSASAIGATTVHLSDSVFREMNIPYFDNLSITLPIRLWAVVLRGLWFLGFSKNTESITEAKYRAKLASEKLIELAAEHHSVLLVGHGFLNHYVAKELLANNWKGPSTPGKKYWEFSTYQYKRR